MAGGHVLFSHFPTEWAGNQVLALWNSLDVQFLVYMLGGFMAQMIDGALGMAYGVSATSFLLAMGLSPAAASASVHASEIFTSGVSGLSHLRFGNVNKKLFRSLLLPGVLGSIAGAYLLSSFEEYNMYLRPLVALYTLYLGVRIIMKVTARNRKREPVKKLGVLACAGGLLDAFGGGGWGPIVSSTLIAKGRNPVYTIGSVNLTEFFVSFASSLTFIFVLGLNHWQVILGLVLGGVIAAPIAAFLVRKIPLKPMFIFVGTVVIVTSLRTFLKATGAF
ncbi:sulfite exporter TauE/SafE family protein [Marinilongibacter aquaticus]|uniref:sulfite exporter TauE/SafE family protein n=1 Tax=Marinilongibacter aquaticus TaxID=2975157 RepID=UPI0021BD8A6E|nr:sulfite exporter TauE/SafE family protein [Marinilongibacter aquaticus]UBM58741.1 sulfite exporter TauE/SafE family protein [Marinilongibacter aquaticus]